MSRKDDVLDELKNTKQKRRYKKKPSMFSMSSCQNNVDVLSYQLQTKPQKTIKRLLIKLGLYIWSLAVFLSVLSLMGFPVGSWRGSSQTSIESDETDFSIDSNKRSLRTSTSDQSSASSTDLWSSLSNSLFIGGFMDSDSDIDADSDDDSQITHSTDDNSEEEEIPQQILPTTPKQGNKLNKKLEKELACQEEDCISSCVGKMKPKCQKSASCRKDRERVCKRRCRKQRCEDRCKDEPKFGYVEREQRMEKCKDECSGPTAVHNKCIKKCHSQFKPCKNRCHEIASKFSCDRVSDIDRLTSSDSSSDDPFDDQEII